MLGAYWVPPAVSETNQWPDDVVLIAATAAPTPRPRDADARESEALECYDAPAVMPELEDAAPCA